MLGLVCFKFFISDPDVEQSENFNTADILNPFSQGNALPKARELKEGTEWDAKWQINVNVRKCKVMHSDKNNPQTGCWVPGYQF